MSPSSEPPGTSTGRSASLLLLAIALVAGVRDLAVACGTSDDKPSLGAAPRSSRPFARRFVSTWWRLAVLVAVAFAVQENVEHLIAHGHAPIAGALLGPEYPLALPVIGFVSAIAAALFALLARTQEALVVAIEAALQRPTRAPRLGVRPPATALVPHRFGPRSPRGRPRSSGSGFRLNH